MSKRDVVMFLYGSAVGIVVGGVVVIGIILL